MSHFAKVENGVVTAVVVATQAEVNTENHGDAFLWVQTSYSSSFRKCFAGVGSSYDKVRDAFIPAQPHPSWLLGEETWAWEPPIDEPTTDPLVESFTWDEGTGSWIVASII